MGKFLIIIGIVMMIGGFAGTMFTAFSGIAQIPDFVNNIANADELAAQYCNTGETLVTSEGASEYSPGLGYGRSVTYYCEDAQGNQRDVTGEFLQEGLLGETNNIFNSVFGGVSSSFPFIAVIMIGSLLLIVGVMVAVMRRINARPQMINPYASSNFYPSSNSVPMGGQPYTQQPYMQQPYVAPQQPAAAPPPPAANAPQDLAAKLRQLEEARNNGLISMTEYQETRQRILDEMKNTPS